MGLTLGEEGVREMTTTVFSCSPGMVSYNWTMGEQLPAKLLQD